MGQSEFEAIGPGGARRDQLDQLDQLDQAGFSVGSAPFSAYFTAYFTYFTAYFTACVAANRSLKASEPPPDRPPQACATSDAAPPNSPQRRWGRLPSTLTERRSTPRDARRGQGGVRAGSGRAALSCSKPPAPTDRLRKADRTADDEGSGEVTGR